MSRLTGADVGGEVKAPVFDTDDDGEAYRGLLGEDNCPIKI